MAKSLGKALESAIKEDAGTERPPGRGRQHLLMNPCRRDVLSTLTLTPCIGISDISRAVRVKPNTVAWHLDRLKCAGYVLERRIGRRRIFFPEGLLKAEEVNVFHVLNGQGHRRIVMRLGERPGASVSELARRLDLSRQSVSRGLGALEAVELVVKLTDGSHVRYYLTRLLAERGEGFYARSRGFGEWIIKKIEEDGGISPVVIKRNLERIVIGVGPASMRFVLELGVNPYLTSF